MAPRKKASRRLSTRNRNPNPSDIGSLENELFREASRLSATTGANVAVISRRPSGEVRLWGYPSAESVINQYHRYSRQRETTPSVPSLVQAAEARARQYVDLRRREEEMKGAMASDLTMEERGARERQWMMEFLGSEIGRVQTRIQELVTEGGKEKQPIQARLDETGV